jgi:transcriptional regulator GlxA family with amidase domain
MSPTDLSGYDRNGSLRTSVWWRTLARVTRGVAIVAFPGVQLLDVAGPLEVFAVAEEQRPGSYAVEVVTIDGEPVRTSSGLGVAPHRSLRAAAAEPPDTLVVAGGDGTAEALADRRLVDWLAAHGSGPRRLASVCSGAFLLAEAGLLDGRRATTHWGACTLLARRYPAVTVDPDAIYVRDGAVATSAGITAGMDLALALVEEDHGRALALAVARWLVLFVRRPGGQSQFSSQLAAQTAERAPLRDVQAWIHDHPEADLSVTALAQRVAVSPRHFARLFTRETGVTPAVYVERARVEVARRLLEETGLGLDGVARSAGFGSVETLRRAFHRTLGVAPSDYRARFRMAA